MKTTAKRKPTVHNPVNFEPSDYVVLGYFDNQPPQVSPMADFSDPCFVECQKAEKEAWANKFYELFPNGNAYKCQHCGQGNVRYVVSALHVPTGEHTCFGDICCERLELKNHDEFKAKMIRSKAAAAAKALAIQTACAKFLAENDSFAEAYKHFKGNRELHAKNYFANDIANKFDIYGNISEKQTTAFISSIARDQKFAADKAAEVKPSVNLLPGKQTFVGKILSTKVQENAFGFCTKMLVLLDNGNKVWGTLPAALGDAEVGNRVSFVGNLQVSDNDSHFGFFRNPSKAQVI